MPATSDHLVMVERSRLAHEALRADGNHVEWVVSIAFYEALHLVEAVAASDKAMAIDRAVTHHERRDFLYRHPRCRPIVGAYKELHRVSLIARYMDGGPIGVKQFLGKPNVHQLVVVQWLGAIRTWAAGELQIPELAKAAATG